jgi:hypothetical protein
MCCRRKVVLNIHLLGCTTSADPSRTISTPTSKIRTVTARRESSQVLSKGKALPVFLLSTINPPSLLQPSGYAMLSSVTAYTSRLSIQLDRCNSVVIVTGPYTSVPLMSASADVFPQVKAERVDVEDSMIFIGVNRVIIMRLNESFPNFREFFVKVSEFLPR